MRKLSIRFLAFFLSVFLCFSVVSSRYFYTRARAMDPGTAAGLIVAGGGVATGGALIPFVAIATIVALAGYEINAYISDAARANGQTKTEYISDLFHEYCNAQSETGEAVATTIATGATVTRNGIINIVGAGAAKLKDFLGWIAGNAETFTDLESVPKGTFFGNEVVDGLYNYDGYASFTRTYRSGSVSYFYLTINPQILPYRAAIYNSTYGGAIYYVQLSTRSGMSGEPDLYLQSINGATATKEGEFRISSNMSVHGYVDSDFIYTFNLPVFNSRAEASNYINTGDYSNATNIGYAGSAIIGDWVDMTHAQSYLDMDDLTTGDAYILNPGILDGLQVPDVASDIPIGIDTYIDIAGQVIDKNPGDAIDFPTDVATDIPTIINPGLPTVAPPVIGIPQVGEDVINPAIPDDPVIEIPSTNVAGLVDEMNPVFQWGLSYISPQKGILSKFPFSIAYDLYLLIASLSGESQDAIFADPNNLTLTNDLSPPTSSYSSYTSALVWDLNFNIPVNGSNISFPIHIDLSQFEWFFRVIRVGVGVVWLIGLFNWARKEVN